MAMSCNACVDREQEGNVTFVDLSQVRSIEAKCDLEVGFWLGCFELQNTMLSLQGAEESVLSRGLTSTQRCIMCILRES